MTSMNSETASTLRSTTGAGSTRADDETPVTPAQPVHPYVHVVVVAVIGAVVVIAIYRAVTGGAARSRL